MKKYLKLMRVKHYIKNMLIFLPIIFSGGVFAPGLFVKVLIGFISFSLVASAVYVVNDIHDMEYDRSHDLKKARPIASGEISIKKAWIMVGALLLAAALLDTIFINIALARVLLAAYFLINVAYSCGLKNIPIIDISIIVAGFILRVGFGGAIIDVKISSWMFLTVMAMSFYLALGKRRNEIKKNKGLSRIVLKYYSEQFLDKMMYVSLGITIVFYSLWCLTPNEVIENSERLIWTVPFFLLICMKYSMDIEGDSYGDPADVLLGDKVLIVMAVLYAALLAALVYGPRIFAVMGM
jgi:decaprenyl-phosphate phosphoribosyltransferase